jgi:arylsulfatase
MPPLPFFDGETVRETDPDQALFTQRLTDAAIAFISQHRTQPLFVYLPYVMPHVPIFASEKFRGLRNDLYAEVVEELDASVGRVLAVLDEYGLRENTWVIFSSDNGPFLSYGKHAGETGGLREGKLTAFEGGVRVPCLMRWPGKISADRVCRTPIMTIDLLPTINRLVGGKSPAARIDGIDIGNILFGTEDLPRPHPYLAFYNGNELHAIRSMQWKLHFPHPYLTVDGTPGVNGKPARYGELRPQSINQSGTAGIASRHGYRVEQIPLSLFDLERDPGETTNLSAENPQVIARLSSYADEIRTELGDSLTGKKGLAGQVRLAGGL